MANQDEIMLQAINNRVAQSSQNTPTTPVNTPVGMNGQTPNSNPSQAVLASSTTAPQDDLYSYVQQMGNANLASQKALLEQTKSSAIAQLEKTYLDAVEEGKISVRDAQQKFLQQKSTLEKEAFNQSKITSIYGDRMGIQHSAQQQALMQSDGYRTQGLINQNISTRDQRLNNIKDRMSSLSLKRGLDMANVENQYQFGLQKANADVQSQMAGENLATARTMSDRAYQTQRDDVAYSREVAMQDAQFAQRFKELDVNQQNDLEKMAIQHGYSMSEMYASADLARRGASAQEAASVIREMKSYGIKPNANGEYDESKFIELRLAQQADERKQIKSGYIDAALGKANAEILLSPEPDKPKSSTMYDGMTIGGNMSSDKQLSLINSLRLPGMGKYQFYDFGDGQKVYKEEEIQNYLKAMDARIKASQ